MIIRRKYVYVGRKRTINQKRTTKALYFEEYFLFGKMELWKFYLSEYKKYCTKYDKPEDNKIKSRKENKRE